MKLSNVLLSLMIGATALPGFAQSSKEETLADLNRTGGVYYAYPVTESRNTPAPKGYQPFYVSHYGRHGSRYLISDNDYKSVADKLHEADRAGALTPLGRDVMQRVDSVIKETHLRGGDLSPLGVRQHRDIAERMYRAYPQVFADDAEMSARSTLVVRCVLSMDAFCERLKELNPRLDITRESSQRYMDYLCHHSDESNAWRDDPNNFKEEYRKFEESHTNPDRLMATLFSDPKYVARCVNPHDMMWGLYWIASGMQDIETDIDFYDIFTPDELYDLYQCFNYRFYAGDGNYLPSDGLIIYNAAPLLENIITSADEAIASGKPGATLRFGHDGNVIPLVALMHMEDCDIAVEDPEKFDSAFSVWKIAPMACNVQLIFFRDPKHPEKDVLVKLMLNEEEKRIPVDTDIFPFYRWDDVKRYYRTEVLTR
ncbi:MAG: histidine phosphatase family protein [Muribaculaceae bacterium]|nr:histidine phosphatase family protein [Muribaculaceae bacterium]MDE7080530.1 histidine phosphatase family protein [Muribaculaceae bacterium]